MHWENLPLVLFFSIVPAAAIVSLYALGIRLLTASGRTPVVAPLEFTDAIAVVTPEEILKNEKRARQAAKKNPLSQAQKNAAFVAAWLCFLSSGAVVLLGIWLILPISHK